MTRLIWGEAGSRLYEAGIDRGVLYVSDLGYVWDGLISVQRLSVGGEPKPYYLDGIKYLNVAAAEEFSAILQAFSAPSQFSVCDGVAQVANGLFATEQPRVPFGLSYRTKIGNDIDGLDHGYKLHLVYNALSSPAVRNNVSLSASVAPLVLSWSISTTPEEITDIKPTAHLIVNSTLVDPALLTILENNIYGTDIIVAHLPTPAEVIAFLTP